MCWSLDKSSLNNYKTRERQKRVFCVETFSIHHRKLVWLLVVVRLSSVARVCPPSFPKSWGKLYCYSNLADELLANHSTSVWNFGWNVSSLIPLADFATIIKIRFSWWVLEASSWGKCQEESSTKDENNAKCLSSFPEIIFDVCPKLFPEEKKNIKNIIWKLSKLK